MNKLTFSTYAKENGGRVSLLFLLFLLAIYEFVTAGFNTFAIICLSPLLVLPIVISFQRSIWIFWVLIIVNAFLQNKNVNFPGPMSLYNELLEIILLAIALIDVKYSHFERAGNLMLFTLMIWCGYCTLQVLNDTCSLGIDVGAWYTGARLMAFQLMYTFLVFSIYISKPDILIKYIFFWGALSLFATF